MDERLPFFFYGTLRRGERAEMLVLGAISRRVPARARGRLVDTGEQYPGVAFQEDAGDIEGELVWLDPSSYEEVVAQLDIYEGAPHLFRRRKISVLAGDEEVEAFAYEYVSDPDGSGD